jgi:hypothetical protein
MARAEPAPNRGNSLPDATREQLEALLRAGEPVKQAARTLGVAPGTARAARRRLGLPAAPSTPVVKKPAALTTERSPSHQLAGTGSAYSPLQRAAFTAGYYQAFKDLGWNVEDLRCRCGKLEREHLGGACGDCPGFRVARRIG